LDWERAVKLADTIHGWCHLDELRWLHRMAEMIGEGGCWVEIGSWKGRSLMATAMGLRPGRRLIAVENFKGNPESQHHWEAELAKGNWLRRSLVSTMEAIRELSPELDVVLMQKDSLEAAKLFSDDSVDQVFIDASHTYEEISADILAWKPKLRKGGVLSGHDFHSVEWPDVYRAVRDYVPNYCLGPGSIWFSWSPVLAQLFP
jgi:predicted O-methyltransferase YrrM